jgi:hypothetical protein
MSKISIKRSNILKIEGKENTGRKMQLTEAEVHQ